MSRMKYIRKNGIKDPGSAITHGIALILAVVGTLPLLLKAAREPDHLHVVAMAVFMLSMILLYLASTVYHTFDVNGKVNRRLKKFDHMMISVLIAGSYTPICLIALHGRTGIVLCALVWAAGFSSRHSGSTVRSGFLQCCISQWAGCAFWRFIRCFWPSRGRRLDGCWPAELFIQSAG